jgi:hypothetical protein
MWLACWAPSAQRYSGPAEESQISACGDWRRAAEIAMWFIVFGYRRVFRNDLAYFQVGLINREIGMFTLGMAFGYGLSYCVIERPVRPGNSTAG